MHPRKNGKRPQLLISAVSTRRPVQRIASYEEREMEPGSEDFASEIFPWLYLGNAKDSVNYDFLCQKNIRYILNTTKEVDSPESPLKGFHFLKLNLEDNSDAPIRQHFASTSQFIEDARKQNAGVLVHCRRGISRSAAIVIAYVMSYQKVSFEDAFDFVKQRRAIINPNLGFVLALESINGFQTDTFICADGQQEIRLPYQDPIGPALLAF